MANQWVGNSVAAWQARNNAMVWRPWQESNLRPHFLDEKEAGSMLAFRELP